MRVSVALLLVLSLVGGRVQAQGDVKDWPIYDDGKVVWSYRPIPDKDECTIALKLDALNKISGEVVIPGEIKVDKGKTYRVVELWQSTFEYKKGITKVTVPEGVTTIGPHAFAESSVESVVLPSTLRKIGFYAFNRCKKLSSITIPEGVRKVEYNTFEECESLGSVTLPNSIDTIGEFAFVKCRNLRRIELPSGVKEIGKSAFFGCSLEVLPNIQGVEVFNYNAFGRLNLTSLRIPEGVKRIDKRSFYGCNRLAQLTIPSSVESIGVDAFAVAGEDAKAAPNYSVYFLAGEDCAVAENAFPAKEKMQGSTPPKLYVKEGMKETFKKKNWVTYAGFEVEEVGDDKYLVTFDARGGAPQPSMAVVSKDGTVPAPKKEGKDITPEREGYEFLGWYDQEDKTEKKYDFENSKVQKDVTLVAKWGKKKFRVVIVSSRDESVPEVRRILTGDLVQRPKDQEKRVGYRFDKWCSTNGVEVTFPLPVMRDTVIWAAWIKLFKVVLDVKGGELIDNWDGKKIDTTLWRIPNRGISLGGVTGYTIKRGNDEFRGWYLKGKPYNLATPVTSDLTLEAKWAKKCVVTFDANGGIPVPPNQTVAEGEKAKMPSQIPEKGGFIFKGWYLEKGKEPFSFGTTEVKDNLTLVAKWVKECVVTFDANGGTQEPDALPVVEGEKVTKPSPDPSKEGYVFKGWFVGEDLYSFGTTVVDGDLTLVAKWAKVCKVSFNADGGKPSPEEQKVEEGGRVTRPSLDPSKEGYWFSGWFVDGKPYDFNGAVAGDFEIVAQWYKKATAVESVLLSGVQVAPNPIGEELALQGVAAAERVEVYSIDGVLVYSGLATGSEREVIALRGLRSGVYLVRVVARDGEKVLRVVKK